MHEAAALRRLDHLIWSLVAIVAAIVLSAPVFSRFYLEWTTFLAPLMACLALTAAGWFYSRVRPDPRLASALVSTAQVVAIAAVGAPLSYLAAAAAAPLPLIDQHLDAIDHATGLDWHALLSFLDARPTLFAILRVTYLSLTVQMTTVVLCLAFCGEHVWLRVYTLAFLLAALATIALSAILPAAGVWPYHGFTTADAPSFVPTVSTSWPVFYGLRDGSFRALVAVGSEGIITFPSLHAALAVILIGALWPLARLRWLILAVNTTMLAATPIDGSHYFADVWAGVVIAIAGLSVARTIAAKSAHASEAEFVVKCSQLSGSEQQVSPPRL
jgi:PAP2 superfamily